MGLFDSIGSILGGAVGNIIPGVGTAVGSAIGGGLAGAISGSGAGRGQGARESEVSEWLLPDWYAGARETLVNDALDTYNTPFTPYEQQRIADFTPDELAAFQQIRDLQGQYTGLTNQAADLLGGVSERALMAPDLGTLQQYMNPYQQGVTDIAKREAIRDWEPMLQRNRDTAAMTGAFGGGRAQLMESEAYKNMHERLNDIQTQGLAQNYNQALGQYNLGTQTGMQAAGALGSLAGQTQGLGLQATEALRAAGSQQRALDQAGLDFDYSEFMRELNYPYQQTEYLGSALGYVPYNSFGMKGVMQATPAQGSTIGNIIGGANTALGMGGYDWGDVFGGLFGGGSGGTYTPLPSQPGMEGGNWVGSSGNLAFPNRKDGGLMRAFKDGGRINKRREKRRREKELGINSKNPRPIKHATTDPKVDKTKTIKRDRTPRPVQPGFAMNERGPKSGIRPGERDPREQRIAPQVMGINPYTLHRPDDEWARMNQEIFRPMGDIVDTPRGGQYLQVRNAANPEGVRVGSKQFNEAYQNRLDNYAAEKAMIEGKLARKDDTDYWYNVRGFTPERLQTMVENDTRRLNRLNTYGVDPTEAIMDVMHSNPDLINTWQSNNDRYTRQNLQGQGGFGTFLSRAAPMALGGLGTVLGLPAALGALTNTGSIGGSALYGGLSSALTGGNPLQGALTGGIGGAVNANNFNTAQFAKDGGHIVDGKVKKYKCGGQMGKYADGGGISSWDFLFGNDAQAEEMLKMPANEWLFPSHAPGYNPLAQGGIRGMGGAIQPMGIVEGEWDWQKNLMNQGSLLQLLLSLFGNKEEETEPRKFADGGIIDYLKSGLMMSGEGLKGLVSDFYQGSFKPMWTGERGPAYQIPQDRFERIEAGLGRPVAGATDVVNKAMAAKAVEAAINDTFEGQLMKEIGANQLLNAMGAPTHSSMLKEFEEAQRAKKAEKKAEEKTEARKEEARKVNLPLLMMGSAMLSTPGNFAQQLGAGGMAYAQAQQAQAASQEAQQRLLLDTMEQQRKISDSMVDAQYKASQMENQAATADYQRARVRQLEQELSGLSPAQRIKFIERSIQAKLEGGMPFDSQEIQELVNMRDTLVGGVPAGSSQPVATLKYNPETGMVE